MKFIRSDSVPDFFYQESNPDPVFLEHCIRIQVNSIRIHNPADNTVTLEAPLEATTALAVAARAAAGFTASTAFGSVASSFLVSAET